MSPSSRALDALLNEESDEAEAVKRIAHRTVLWRYRTGKGKPEAEVVAKLERASGGRVPANGWEDEPAEASTASTSTPAEGSKATA